MKRDKIHIAILLGTTRTGRRSENAALLVKKIGEQISEIEIKYVDPKEFSFSLDGNNPETQDTGYTEITTWADGFFIVTPEYNHGYPGSLKRMLDTEYKNYFYKAVALAGVSIGMFGGARCIEALQPVIRELHMLSTATDVNFARVTTIFDDEGKLLDESYIKRVENSYRELIWLAQTLRDGRENIEK